MKKKFTIKIAEYKNSKTFFGKIIRIQQKLQGLPGKYSRLSHAELILCYTDDKEVLKLLRKIETIYFGKRNIKTFGEKRIEYFKKFDLWFSSSEIDGGTRFKFIEDKKKNWVYKELEITKTEYIAILEYFIAEADNNYGFLSIIFTQALKTFWFINRKSPFCSQIVLQGLQIIGLYGLLDAVLVNPGRLGEITKNIQKDYNNFKKITC